MASVGVGNESGRPSRAAQSISGDITAIWCPVLNDRREPLPVFPSLSDVRSARSSETHRCLVAFGQARLAWRGPSQWLQFISRLDAAHPDQPMSGAVDRPGEQRRWHWRGGGLGGRRGMAAVSAISEATPAEVPARSHCLTGVGALNHRLCDLPHILIGKDLQLWQHPHPREASVKLIGAGILAVAIASNIA